MSINAYAFLRTTGANFISPELKRLMGSIGFPIFTPNNPWRFFGPDNAEIELPEEVEGISRGFGNSLADATTGESEPIGEKELRELIKQYAENPDKNVRALLGVEMNAAPLDGGVLREHWCAGNDQGRSFGTRSAVGRQIGASALKDAGLTGKGVKIMVCDQGFDRNLLTALGGTYGGGMGFLEDDKWTMPGVGPSAVTPRARRHGDMMLRTLVDLAPDATYYDLPLIPRRIDRVEPFALRAIFALNIVESFIPEEHRPDIIVNAWGIVSRFSEVIRGAYTDNPDHWLNALYDAIGQDRDVVFAAGNSGLFCGDPRAPGYDIGPGESVLGANGLPNVTSVGAVRSDMVWVGASSQGPGPAGFSNDERRPEKPDIAAPSWFVEDTDAHLRSSGSSAASAVVAGVMAALRQKYPRDVISPSDLRTALRNSASKPHGSNWNTRLGAGVLNVPRLLDQLSTLKAERQVALNTETAQSGPLKENSLLRPIAWLLKPFRKGP